MFYIYFTVFLIVIKFAKTSVDSPFVCDNIEALSGLQQFAIYNLHFIIIQKNKHNMES
jgi:hypothetical protein